MLASIHPLGERSRRQRWSVTFGAFVAGSAAGGALVGSAAGVLGDVAGARVGASGGAVAWVAVGACVAALVADAFGSRLPAAFSVRRQVNEDWLGRYRGWVYGVSFGFQLGAGVLTTVVSASVYLALALAFLSGSVVAGALVGLTFGLARAAVLLSVRGASSPQSLRAVHRRHAGLAPAGAAGVLVVEVVTACVAAAVALAARA